MVYKCVVPGCKTGSKTRQNAGDGQNEHTKISCHRFPLDQDMFNKWVRAIPRGGDWNPHKESRVCALHFYESDFVLYHEDSKGRRQNHQKNLLQKRRLRPTAIPRVFPNLPKYLSVAKPVHRNDHATSTARSRFQNEVQEALNHDFLQADIINSFEDIKKYHETNVCFQDVTRVTQHNKVMFNKVISNEINGPQIEFSLTINSDLSFKCYRHNLPLPQAMFKHITKEGVIQRYSDIENIISVVNNAQHEKVSVTKSLTNILDQLQVLADELDDTAKNKFRFAMEQAQLALINKNQRRYSPNLLASSLMWKCTSSGLYKKLLQEDLLSLPSVRYLQKISNAFSLDAGFSKSTISYLKARVQKLSKRERLVIMLLDEIYTSQRLEFQGGKLFGYDEGLPTKTMLCFMLKSVGGQYRDVVALFPIKNVNSELLKDIHDQMLPELTTLGFNVIGLSADNYSANRKYYEDELCAGDMKAFTLQPNGKKIFFAF